MARLIVVVCGPCLEETGEHVPGVPTEPITIGGGKPQVLDLCPEHRRTLLIPLTAALGEHGIDVEHAPQDARLPCLGCDGTYKSIKTLLLHVDRQHPHLSDRAREQYQGKPVDAPRHGGPRTPVDCDRCGAEGLRGPQGLASHQRSAACRDAAAEREAAAAAG